MKGTPSGGSDAAVRQRGSASPHSGVLAWILALAYTLLIVYASLQPFRDWRQPSAEILNFLSAPWPRYITLDDVLINVAAYIPIGFFLALALGARLKSPAAVLAAAALATVLSLTMETLQAYLATRIASKVDVLTNGAGGLIGAMAAPLLSPAGFPGRRLAAWRGRLFAPDSVTDVGIIIVCLWLVTHLHPTAQLFGTGNLHGTLDLPARLAHTPQLMLSAEAAIVFFNVLGVGLLAAALVADSRRAVKLVLGVILAGLVIKALAGVVLFDAPGPLSWLTPGVGVGLATGAILLFPLTRAPRLACLLLALLCLVAAIVAINLAPGNPYQTVPPKLVSASTTQLLRFSSIVRALSELWPFIAVTYLVVAAATHRRPR
jgi:VanZ family protein